MTTTDELKKRIGGYAFLYPFTDEDFDRYQNYDDDDFRSLYELPLSIICIFEIANIITEFCETDCYDDCMMDFLITPSQEALTKIVEHLQIQMNPTEALAIVLQHHLQSKDWNETLASVDNISELVEKTMQILSGFELLDWTEITDKEFLANHELNNLYSSFIPFTQAALNVYADNVGFNKEMDSELFQHAKVFLDDVCKCNTLI